MTIMAVTHAVPTFSLPEALSEIEAVATEAELQPSGSTVTFAASMALTDAEPTIVGSVVNLSWLQDTLTVSVGTSTPPIQTYDVGGIVDVTGTAGEITLAGSEVTLSVVSAGSFNLPVDAGSPEFASQDATLEDGRRFDAALPVLTPYDVGLRRGVPVTQAEVSLSGSDVTLTTTTVPLLPVDHAEPTIAGQDIALHLTWSVAVTAAATSILGKSVTLDWTIDDGVIVVAAEPGFVGVSGSAVDLALTASIQVEEPEITFAGSTVDLLQTQAFAVSVEGPIFQEGEELVFFAEGSEVDLSYTFTLGIEVEPAQPNFRHSNILPFLGSGIPERARVTQKAPSIAISLNAPITSATQEQERIRATG